MYDVFWWCSAMAGLDTRDTRAGIRERYPSAGTTSIRSMLPPEEVTTFNLVRRLVVQQKLHGGQAVATLHSRALEGGRKGQRAPSGADLELAVEVARGIWIDLLLQAKRIYEPAAGGPGTYDGWKSSQIDDLRLWAQNEHRTPGMLLYNAEVSPFGGYQTDVVLDGCCKRTLTCYESRWPPPGMRRNGSPLAITFVILPDLSAPLPSRLLGDSLPVDVVNEFAAPIECIFCPSRLAVASPATKKADLGHEVSPIPVSAEIPRWADDLMTAVELQGRDYLGADTSSEEEEPTATFSLVLSLPEEPE